MQEKRVPQRKCLGCGEMIGKKGAIRLVKSKEDVISLDLTGKMPGRGAYICRDAACLESAKKKRGFERAFKRGIPDEIYENIARELSTDK